MSSIVTVKN